MRKSGWVLAGLAAGMGLARCRSTACAELAAAYADVDQKTRPCMERAPLPTLDPGRCEQNLEEGGGPPGRRFTRRRFTSHPGAG